MLGIIVVLTTLEYMFVALLPPNVKPGLANIVIMYCVFSVGRTHAIALNATKSLFVLLTRGAMAGLLSFCGGMLSIAIIILLSNFKKKQFSYAAISISGACAHNLGQLLIAIIVTATPALVYYFPILIIWSIATGLLTSCLLKIVMPLLQKLEKG